MAYLNETSTWEPEIYRIQVYDPILGGAEGVVNIQPRQIGSRTKWLLGLLGAEHPVEGEHSITDDMVASNAAIAESKAVLDVPFEKLHAMLDELDINLDILEEDVSEFTGSDGLRIAVLSRALQELWKTAASPFSFEFFEDSMSMRKSNRTYQLIDVVSTVKGDDTVIVESTEGLQDGDSMLVTSQDKIDTELVTIKKVLNDTRFLAVSPLSSSRKSGYVTACTWDMSRSPAVAQAGGVYLSGPLSTLSRVSSGTFVIRRDSTPGVLSVYAGHVEGDGRVEEWHALSLTESRKSGTDYYDDFYIVPQHLTGSAIIFQVKNDTGASISVYHLALAAALYSANIDVIERPTVLDPYGTVYADAITMLCSTYRNIWRDPFERTDFRFTPEDGGESYVVSTDKQYPENTTMSLEMLPEGAYRVSARHVSDMGDISPWSEPVDVYVQPSGEFFGFEGAPHSDRFLDGTDDADEVSPFRSLDYELIRFGFDGTDHTGGFDTVLFATAGQLDNTTDISE